VDLDHFKLVNDTYGHHAGDELIRAVAGRLQALLGDAATVARMGGDEFAVVLQDPQGTPDLDRVPDRPPDGWPVPVGLPGATVPVSASVGVASCADPGRTAEQLLRDADVALYRAKNTRRGSVRRFDSALRVEVERRTALDHELHTAVARSE
ncbi:diguanylate cyclase domain-containing protein, partial [Pectobacterium brasiliense]|uniref:GGDEF domain-containing protein n=1 Tax=Pectobacterium brasiliense TaxID=180957 RepID=UPI000BC87737